MKRNNTIIAILITIAFFIFVYLLEPILANNIKLITGISILSITSVGIYMKFKNKLSIKNIIILVIIIGILIRAMYIMYTPITERQHDVYTINDNGHLGYIYQIYETGNLPESNSIQFYHPPLFHLVGAGWLKINSVLDMNLDRAIEGLQILTAIFSSLILIYTYKITDRLEINDKYKLLINLIIIFHPTFIIMSGSINNDILMILLTFIIIFYLIEWAKKSSLKNTIILAIVTGLAVMTKVSAAIMAVPILYVFIDKYFKELKQSKKILNWNFIKMMLVFGIISLPIGLWHPIRNLILFNQPIGGILIPSPILDVSNYSIVSRFFSLSFKELIIETFSVIPGDYNILASIIKTSVLGEFTYKNIDTIALLIKIVNLLIVSIAVICSIRFIFKKEKKNRHILNILIITWIINIISYYYFNISYPYLCTMNFRYLVPTIYTGVVAICITLENTKYKIIKNFIEYFMIIFCVLSILMFFSI